jgi:hypothetical protein
VPCQRAETASKSTTAKLVAARLAEAKAISRAKKKPR